MIINNPFLPVQSPFFSVSRSIIALSVFLFIVVGCGDTAVKEDPAPVKGNASREDLMKIIEGGWVNSDYADALNRVHSPMFAAEAGRPVQELMFEVGGMKGDTVVNSTGRLNYLTGERFDVVLFDENGVTKMKIYQGETGDFKPLFLDYTFEQGTNDTLLMIINPGSNDTTWFRREFHKAPAKAGIAQNALEHYVNRALFGGEWLDTEGNTVTFDPNGTVKGWDKWTWYSVEIDKYGTEIQPDVMSAYNDKFGATYVFTLDNDRLQIYEYDSEKGDAGWTRGKVVAEFKRK